MPPPLAPIPPPLLRISPIAIAILKALNYMQSIDPVGSEILDIQANMMQNVRLVVATRVIG